MVRSQLWKEDGILWKKRILFYGQKLFQSIRNFQARGQRGKQRKQLKSIRNVEENTNHDFLTDESVMMLNCVIMNPRTNFVGAFVNSRRFPSPLFFFVALDM